MEHLQRALLSIARQEQSVAISLGPHGLDHLIIDEANQPVITNSGDTILTASSPDDALGALLLKLVTDSCSHLGDCSKRMLLMVTAGLRQFLRSGLHPLSFQAALAAQVLECVVPSAVLHVPMCPGHEEEASEALRALLSTHMCGKAGGRAASEHLADVLGDLVELQLRAAARAGVTAAEALAALRDSPPLARLSGQPPELSRLLPGVLLGEAPLNPGAGMGPSGVLSRPAFLALTCPLEGEELGCVGPGTAAAPLPATAYDGDGLSGGGGAYGLGPAADAMQPPPPTAAAAAPAVGLRVTCERGRQEAERGAAELLRAKIACLAGRGVKLLLLCGRPPAGAVQLCQQYGIWLVAGLDEQDVVRACAAGGGGGGAPLGRSGLAALAAAPLGLAAAARVVGLGPRRGTLLEFDQEAAVGQAACTLLLCAANEAAVRQSVHAVRRCLVSLAASVGTMARPPPPPPSTSPEQRREEGEEAGMPEEVAECLVFVGGGGGFEGLLELQLRELLAAAQRGLEAAQEQCGQRCGDGVLEAAAAEAAEKSKLLASLRVLHAMAAAVPMTLAGGNAAGEAGDGGAAAAASGVPTAAAAAAEAGAGSGLPPPGAHPAAARRAQREALIQVTALRAAQSEALQRGRVSRAGLVVPSAAFSFTGRALHRLRREEEEQEAGALGSVEVVKEEGRAASAATAAGAGACERTCMNTGAGNSGGGGGGDSGARRGVVVHGATSDSSEGGGCGGGVRDRPVLGGHRFVAGDAVGHGVLEAAAVAGSAWSGAVEVLSQVLRIQGPVLSATRSPGHADGGGDGGKQGGFRLAGPPAAVAPRARRGARPAGWGPDSADDDGGDGGSGNDSSGE